MKMHRMEFKKAKSDTTRDRWIVRDENGNIVAKLYVQPTNAFLASLRVASTEYRGRVNARCSNKGIDALYPISDSARY